MPTTRTLSVVLVVILVVVAVLAAVAVRLGRPIAAEAAANALIRPLRTRSAKSMPHGCSAATWRGRGVDLCGWYCRTEGPRRGVIVYLHGVSDNRASAIPLIGRYLPRGFDVVAYDSRAHGDSSGEFCTYGYHEAGDLSAVIDSLPKGPIILFGGSLGGAIAILAASRDSRVGAVVAAETFSDLRTVALERAPRFLTSGVIRAAFAVAEQRARFTVDEVSPARRASRITAPVLLIHGAADTDTPPSHSERVFAALPGRKRLVLVPGAGHNRSLSGPVWDDIDAWIDEAAPRRVRGPMS